MKTVQPDKISYIRDRILHNAQHSSLQGAKQLSRQELQVQEAQAIPPIYTHTHLVPVPECCCCCVSCLGECCCRVPLQLLEASLLRLQLTRPRLKLRRLR
jgi:hypothetical protein